MSFKLSIGKMGIAGNDMYGNEAILFFKHPDPITNKFLYNWLRYNDVSKYASGQIGKGSLNKTSIYKIQIPIPPLNIQNKIVQQIELLQSESSHYDTYAKSLEKELDSINEIIQNMTKDKADFNDNWNKICTKYNLDTISDDETQDINKFIKCQTKFLYKIIPELAKTSELDDSDIISDMSDTEDNIMEDNELDEAIIDEENEKLNERISQSTKVIRTK
jgi:hypothetical protein